MKNAEFIKAVADRATKDGDKNVTQRDAKIVIKAIGDVLLDEIAAGNLVKAFDGIQFEGVTRATRSAVNPQTGEKITIPEHLAPKCKFTKGFKDLVAGRK